MSKIKRTKAVKSNSKISTPSFVPCEIKQLAKGKLEQATLSAIKENPNNQSQSPPDVQALVAYTNRYWGSNGVDLTVQFLDTTNQPLIDRILSHFNSYNAFCNVKFRHVKKDGQVRVTLNGEGYWSYLGTDILLVPKTQATMCLSRFNINTSEAEYRRVVRHEVGHTLGFPHGHLLPDIVNRIDKQKAYKKFEQVYGWSKGMVDSNVLTPLKLSELMGDFKPDYESIMDYQLWDDIFIDGKGVKGGVDFTLRDMQDCAKLFPLSNPVIFGKGGQAFAAEGKVIWKNSRNETKSVTPYPGHTGEIRIASNGVHLATAPGPGGGPHVKCYHIESGQETASFHAIDANFRKGAFVTMAIGWGQVRVTLGEGAGSVYQEFDPAGGRAIGGVAQHGNPASRTGLTCAFWGNPNAN